MTRNHPYFVEAERYFRASQLRLPSLLRESDLLAAQCMFFTAVYLSFTMRIVAAWKAFAQAGTHCLAHLSWRGIIDQSVDSIRSPGTLLGSPFNSVAELTSQIPRQRTSSSREYATTACTGLS